MPTFIDLLKAKIPILNSNDNQETFELANGPNALIILILFEIIWNIIMFGFIAPFLWNSVRPALMSSKPVKGLILFKTAILISIMFGFK